MEETKTRYTFEEEPSWKPSLPAAVVDNVARDGLSDREGSSPEIGYPESLMGYTERATHRDLPGGSIPVQPAEAHFASMDIGETFRGGRDDLLHNLSMLASPVKLTEERRASQDGFLEKRIEHEDYAQAMAPAMLMRGGAAGAVRTSAHNEVNDPYAAMNVKQQQQASAPLAAATAPKVDIKVRGGISQPQPKRSAGLNRPSFLDVEELCDGFGSRPDMEIGCRFGTRADTNKTAGLDPSCEVLLSSTSPALPDDVQGALKKMGSSSALEHSRSFDGDMSSLANTLSTAAVPTTATTTATTTTAAAVVERKTGKFEATIDTLYQMEHIRVALEVSPRSSGAGLDTAFGEGTDSSNTPSSSSDGMTTSSSSASLPRSNSDMSVTDTSSSAEPQGLEDVGGGGGGRGRGGRASTEGSLIHSRRVFGPAMAFEDFNCKLAEALNAHGVEGLQRLRRSGSTSAPPTIENMHQWSPEAACRQMQGLISTAVLPDGVTVESLAHEPAAEAAGKALCKMLYTPANVQAVLGDADLLQSVVGLVRTRCPAVFRFAVVAVSLVLDTEQRQQQPEQPEQGDGKVVAELERLPAEVQVEVRRQLETAATEKSATPVEGGDDQERVGANIQRSASPFSNPGVAASGPLAPFLAREGLGARRVCQGLGGTGGVAGGLGLGVGNSSPRMQTLLKNEVRFRAKLVLDRWAA